MGHRQQQLGIDMIAPQAGRGRSTVVAFDFEPIGIPQQLVTPAA